MKPSMKLFYFPLSTYSQKALIALYEKGLAFEPELVNLASTEARAAFEAIYPIGKVPYLKYQGGTMGLPESTAIIEYLDEAHPDTPRLVPLDREAARQVRFSDRMCDLYVNEPVAELLFQKIGWRQVDDEKAARARKHLTAAFANMEQRLAQQDWLCGAFSMADCAAIPPLFYAQFVFPFADRPALMRYWQRAQQRPSYAKVMAEFVPLWEQRMAAPKT